MENSSILPYKNVIVDSEVNKNLFSIKIPDDILKIIIQNLYIHDFINFIKTCKRFYSLRNMEQDYKDNIKYLNIEYLNMDIIYKKSYELGIIKIYNLSYNQIYKYWHLLKSSYENEYTLNVDNFEEIFKIVNILGYTSYTPYKQYYYNIMKFIQPPRHKHEFLKYMYFNKMYLYFKPPGYETLIHINLFNNINFIKQFYIESRFLDEVKLKKSGIPGEYKEGLMTLVGGYDYVNFMWIIEEIVNCFNIVF